MLSKDLLKTISNNYPSKVKDIGESISLLNLVLDELIVFTVKKYPKATGLACPAIDEYNDHKNERKKHPLNDNCVSSTVIGNAHPYTIMVIIHNYWVDDKTKPDFFTLGAEKIQFALSVALH